MEFRVLGELEARGAHGRVPVNGKRQRALLAVLLLRSGQVVGVDELAALAWPDRPHDAARKQVKIAVSALRKAFGDPGVILTRSPGYVIETSGHRLDLRWCEALVRAARTATAPEEKARYLREALEEFRGPVLPGIDLDTEVLEELRAEIIEGLRRAEQGEVRPAQLPADIAELSGRFAETDRLCASLEGSPSGYAPALAVITGAPGTGKSALAVRVGHRLRSEFPDGQLYADFRSGKNDPLSTLDVMAGFLRALGASQVPDGSDERAALYRSVLAERRVLVVLDNVADEEQVAPLLPGCGGCAVLATSRRRLTGLAGAHRVELSGLSSHESLTLLDALVGEGRVAAEQLAARRIAFLCEGLPLALRIVGAKLADHPQWTLQRMADRLAVDAHRLAELRHGGLDLREALEGSVRALGPHAGRLFRRLGLLGFSEITPTVAGALAGVSSERAARLLESLAASRVLLAGDGDRYRLPDLFRLLAREHCAPEGEGGPAQVGLGVLT
ncbi:hypothetical protein GCM10022247_33300 [Allokutzneria multivorans]|uniref:OmpR/PhoB-type domain-containing protein n=1 Tax=Allokutzneria multivorans TaxID=1142134 RepID=A0ABP7S9B7_9PSEU